ncbi:hypothetical protein ACFVHQ_19480 [Actinomycetes bacterium NPDC127524]
MSYKESFIKKAKMVYRDSVLYSEAGKNAEHLITNYFADIALKLEEEFKATSDLSLSVIPGKTIEFILGNMVLTIKFNGDQIDFIFIDREADDVETDNGEIYLILDYDDYKFYTEKRHVELSNDFLDAVLQKVFDNELEYRMTK